MIAHTISATILHTIWLWIGVGVGLVLCCFFLIALMLSIIGFSIRRLNQFPHTGDAPRVLVESGVRVVGVDNHYQSGPL